MMKSCKEDTLDHLKLDNLNIKFLQRFLRSLQEPKEPFATAFGFESSKGRRCRDDLQTKNFQELVRAEFDCFTTPCPACKRTRCPQRSSHTTWPRANSTGHWHLQSGLSADTQDSPLEAKPQASRDGIFMRPQYLVSGNALGWKDPDSGKCAMRTV